jgi:hypothetical protein
MAEGMEMKDLVPEDTTNPYDDINNLQDLQGILNDSKYGTVQSLTVGTFEETKLKMLNEDLSTLQKLVTNEYSNIDVPTFELESVKLKQRLMRKGYDLYLRTKGPGIKTVTFGTHKYKAIQITENNGKNLVGLNTLKSNGMSTQDAYYKILNGERETSFTQQSVEQRDREIEELEELRKQAVSIWLVNWETQTSHLDLWV